MVEYHEVTGQIETLMEVIEMKRKSQLDFSEDVDQLIEVASLLKEVE